MQPQLKPCAGLAIALTLALCPAAQSEQCRFQDNATQVFISDTHVGMAGECSAGDDCRNGWHNMEDFRWLDEFSAFLTMVETRIAGPTDLVVLGDFLELWQDPTGQHPCGPEGAARSNFGCSAEQAKRRIDAVVDRHENFFNRLIRFGRDEGHRIVLVPGNHDAVLAMAPVAAHLKRKMSGGQVCIDEDGTIYGQRGEAGVFVEHGHQMKGDLNRYEDPTNGVVECLIADGDSVDCGADGAFVRRSWGENMVQNFFNHYEREFPAIDNYSAEKSGLPDGLKRGLKASSPDQRSGAFLRFVRFFFARQTASHLGALLGDEEGVTEICAAKINRRCIDRSKMQTLVVGDEVFASLPDGLSDLWQILFGQLARPDATLADVYAYNPGEEEVLNDLLVTTCLYWAERDTEDQAAGDIACPHGNEDLGAKKTRIGRWFKRLGDENYDPILEHIEGRVAESGEDIRIFVYGHTHKAQVVTFGKNKPMALNTGAFQRVASDRVIGRVIDVCVGKDESDASRKDKEDRCFRNLTPNDLPACYSTVIYQQGTAPKLYWWTNVENGKTFALYEHTKQPDDCKT